MEYVANGTPIVRDRERNVIGVKSRVQFVSLNQGDHPLQIVEAQS